MVLHTVSRFTPNNVNEFEVFVAGKRLRKNSISSYVFSGDPHSTR